MSNDTMRASWNPIPGARSYDVYHVWYIRRRPRRYRVSRPITRREGGGRG